jgi:hypothetical protein
LAAGLAAAGLAATGCSVLVEPADTRVRCEVREGVDPCPSGQRCLDGFCTGGADCTGPEVGCNGVDDDCDGSLDEGSDADGDGFTWCDADPRQRDCRDDNGSVRPTGADGSRVDDVPCDGVDNDCDGAAAECPVGQACDPTGACRVPDCTFALMCPGGQRCNTDVTPAQCEDVATDCMMTGCGAGLVCDPLSRLCEPPRELGRACVADAQCVEGALCVARTALGLAAEDVGGDSVCTRACCSDTDCGAGARCWVSGTGARGCVPDTILRAGPSGLPRDAACTSSDDCADECALRLSPAYRTASRSAYTCGAPIGDSFVACEDSSECVSGICIEYCESFFCSSVCSAPCGATSDCTGVETCGWLDARGGFLQTCLLGQDGASAGAACASDTDCRDGACLSGATGRYCADVCCSDSQCPEGARCRPLANHGRWEMLCVRE